MVALHGGNRDNFNTELLGPRIHVFAIGLALDDDNFNFDLIVCTPDSAPALHARANMAPKSVAGFLSLVFCSFVVQWPNFNQLGPLCSQPVFLVGSVSPQRSLGQVKPVRRAVGVLVNLST